MAQMFSRILVPVISLLKRIQMMDTILNAKDVVVGFHPGGFRIDKTASPLNFYTRWEISGEGKWKNPTPVCFDSLPAEGWIKVDCYRNWPDRY